MQRLPTIGIHPEVGLPIYDAEIPVAPVLDRLRKLPGDTALRKIGLGFPAGYDDLPKGLGAADEIFNEVAETSGAEVVPHSWGLSPLDRNSYRDSYQHDLVPTGYRLVAEVAIIHKIRPPRWRQYRAIEASLRHHRRHADGLFWLDGDVGQFGRGFGPGDTARRLWLLDIEPRFVTPT